MRNGNRSIGNYFTEADIPSIRDPFILVEDDGTLYCYGTGWVAYKNTSGNLAEDWQPLGVVVNNPEDYLMNPWAPEVYKINGSYYMITTYKSKALNHRGCAVFHSEKPEGPFTQWSDGFLTPADWDSIDGTLYYKNGEPYMVFSHEWTSQGDKGGSFACAKMSDDLKKFVSEPVELFYSKSSGWAENGITDGCFMYVTADNQLLMLWSASYEGSYSVGIARSKNGDLFGPWTFDKGALYTKNTFDIYGGGHGMLFRYGGKMYCTFHAESPDGNFPCVMKVKEENGTLVIDRD